MKRRCHKPMPNRNFYDLQNLMVFLPQSAIWEHSTIFKYVDRANIVCIRQLVNLPDVAECIALRTHKFKVNFCKTFSWAEVVCKLLNSWYLSFICVFFSLFYVYLKEVVFLSFVLCCQWLLLIQGLMFYSLIFVVIFWQHYTFGSGRIWKKQIRYSSSK